MNYYLLRVQFNSGHFNLQITIVSQTVLLTIRLDRAFSTDETQYRYVSCQNVQFGLQINNTNRTICTAILSLPTSRVCDDSTTPQQIHVCCGFQAGS